MEYLKVAASDTASDTKKYLVIPCADSAPYPIDEKTNFAVYFESVYPCKDVTGSSVAELFIADRINIAGEGVFQKIRVFILKQPLLSTDYQSFFDTNATLSIQNERVIIWLEDPSQVGEEQCNQAIQIPLRFNGNRFRGGCDALFPNQPVLPGGTSVSNLYFNAVEPESTQEDYRAKGWDPQWVACDVTFDGRNFRFGNNNGTYFQIQQGLLGQPQTLLFLSRPSLLDEEEFLFFQVPVTGGQLGCFLFSTSDTKWGASAYLSPGTIGGPALCYSFFSDQQGDQGFPSKTVAYPLLKQQTDLNGYYDYASNKTGKVENTTMQLSPWQEAGQRVGIISTPVSSLPTYSGDGSLDLHGSVRPLKSTLLTDTGANVMLTPIGNFAFDYWRALDGTVYMVPVSSFTMTISDGSTEGKLVCGLSGTESIAFKSGDTLMFCPNQPSGVQMSADPDSAEDNPTFVISPDISSQYDCYTSRVMILSVDGSGNLYYCEPQHSSYFKETSHSPTFDYQPFTINRLAKTADQQKGPMFPLVPYSGLSGPSVISPSYLEAFEFQVINPTRYQHILSMANPAQGDNGFTGSMLTPQGYQANVVNGQFQSISIANAKVDAVSEVSVSFRSDTPLPMPLQRAFLANQQFLVITSDQGNLDSLTASVKMSDWSFGEKDAQGPPNLKWPKNTIPGDYENILIFKSGNATVRSMAAHPELWTEYAAFNDVSSDPDGQFLSQWLVNYLDKSITSYDDGKGVSSLARFCQLIDDPNWSGFLALRVKVGDLSTLPVDVQALVDSINGGLYAHHLGNGVNHIGEESTGDYTLTSPFFGLIHYVDPKFDEQAKDPPAYLLNMGTYDFEVLTLEVVFEKALEVHFANKCLLVINEFFGDKVKSSATDNATAYNRLIMVGTYHEVDHVPSYTFAMEGVSTDFYLQSNAINCNRITSAGMNVTKKTGIDITKKTSKKEITYYEARFALRGNLNFLEETAFDLLSYSSVSYNGLTMVVTIPTDKSIQDSQGNTVPTYRLDTSRFQFDLNKTEIGEGNNLTTGTNWVRPGSLVSQFPVKLKGLRQDPNGARQSPPSAMGYRLLATSDPKNISHIDIEAGQGWYGLEFDMVLGGKGALASSGVIGASLILAWTPGGGGTAMISPQFKLSGPGGVSLSFDFEDVLKFGAKAILLNRDQEKGDFYMLFQSIGLSLLGVSFPPGGTTNLILMGDTETTEDAPLNPTLSWLGGYVESQKGS